MTNLSNLLSGSVYSGVKDYILPNIQTFTNPASPISWNSDDIDMIVVSANTSTLTINADSGTPLDGQRLLIRTVSSIAINLTFTGGVSKGFQPIGTSFNINGNNFVSATFNAGIYAYFGCVYNSATSRWDIIAQSSQL